MRAGVLRSDGEQSELFHLPRAAPIAFKSLVVFLVFADAPSRSAYGQTQLDATFSACQRYIVESMKQLVGMVGFDKAEVDYEPVYGEGLLAIMLENLQNMLSPEGATFYLTELYNEYAIKMVSFRFLKWSPISRLTNDSSNTRSVTKLALEYTKTSRCFVMRSRSSKASF